MENMDTTNNNLNVSSASTVPLPPDGDLEKRISQLEQMVAQHHIKIENLETDVGKVSRAVSKGNF